MTQSNKLRFIVGLLLAVFFCWLVVRHIDLIELRRILSRTNPWWIGAGIVIFGLGYACRIERWRIMLTRYSPHITWMGCGGPLLAGFALNNLLPFRSGDILRAFAFNSRLGTTPGIVLATLFVERLLDLLLLLFLLGLVLGLTGIDTYRLAGLGGGVLVFLALFLLILLIFPQVMNPIIAGFEQIINRVFPRWGEKFSREITGAMDTLSHLARGRTVLPLLFWSLMAWLAEGCLFWFAALSLPSLTVPLAGWLAFPVGTLATLIPSTPGYIGTFDYFIIRAMRTLGNHPLAATAYALLVHGIIWFPPTLLGLVYLSLQNLKKKHQ